MSSVNVVTIKQTTKQQLEEKVHNSIKERGIDPSQILQEEPREKNHKLTDEEIGKLEQKRRKNRIHAKRSRDRRNESTAKCMKKLNALKMERSILRRLIQNCFLTREDITVEWTFYDLKLQTDAQNSSLGNFKAKLLLPNDPVVRFWLENNSGYEVKRVGLPLWIDDIMDEDTLGPRKNMELLTESQDTNLFSETLIGGARLSPFKEEKEGNAMYENTTCSGSSELQQNGSCTDSAYVYNTVCNCEIEGSSSEVMGTSFLYNNRQESLPAELKDTILFVDHGKFNHSNVENQGDVNYFTREMMYQDPEQPADVPTSSLKVDNMLWFDCNNENVKICSNGNFSNLPSLNMEGNTYEELGAIEPTFISLTPGHSFKIHA